MAMPFTAWEYMHFTVDQVGTSTKSPQHTHRARPAHSTPSNSPSLPVHQPRFNNASGKIAFSWGRGEVWHKASASGCLPLAVPIGLSPLLILTLCGPERVLVMSTEPPDDLSCLTTPGVGRPRDGAVARAVDQMHPDAPSESMRGFADSSTDLCTLGVHLQDYVPDKGF